MEKFQGKYRIPSARLPTWDYSWDGAYFITICTRGRTRFFGWVQHPGTPDARIHLSEVGEVVVSEWLKTPEIRKDMNVQLGEYAVMPDHFHGIVIIGKNQFNTKPCRDAMHGRCRDAMHCVSTPNSKNRFGPQSKNLASIIRGFKSAVTKRARQKHPDFSWQPRFHDRIIRNAEAFQAITGYIRTNPERWPG